MANERPLLILDLDETVVHASEYELRAADFHVAGLFVYKRPHLDEFLRELSPHFQFAVWTSSSADYASYMVGRLFENHPLAFVWSRIRCTRRYDPELLDAHFVKDLAKVKRQGFDLKRVLMVDDSPEKLLRNYGNLVRVAPFEGNAEDDEFRHLPAYLKSLLSEQDFRRIEKRGWRKRAGDR